MEPKTGKRVNVHQASGKGGGNPEKSQNRGKKNLGKSKAQRFVRHANMGKVGGNSSVKQHKGRNQPVETRGTRVTEETGKRGRPSITKRMKRPLIGEGLPGRQICLMLLEGRLDSAKED